MKVLFVGITDEGAVSSIVTKVLKLFPSENEKYEFHCFGIGKRKIEECGNIHFAFFTLPPLEDILLRSKRKLLIRFHKDHQFVYQKSTQRRLDRHVRDIDPDVIVAAAGQFFYLKAAYEVAKKYNKKLVLFFFDPVKDNVHHKNGLKMLNECKKWCNYASSVLYDADTTPPLDGIDPAKLKPFYIPIFEYNDTEAKNNCIIYGGSFYPGFREPSVLVDFINAQLDQSVEFVVYTYPKIAAQMQNSLKRKTVFHDTVSQEEFIDIAKNCLAIIVMGNNQVEHTIPSKALEAIGYKKPIIAINFSKQLYYADRYPFLFDGTKPGVIERVKDIDEQELKGFDVYSSFPERNPNKLIKLLACSFED